jgi:hypothetical protein
VLIKKFFNVGFEDIAVVERRPFGLGDLTRYPLFAPEFLDFLRRIMPPARHAELVSSIAVTARKPEAAAATASR